MDQTFTKFLLFLGIALWSLTNFVVVVVTAEENTMSDFGATDFALVAQAAQTHKLAELPSGVSPPHQVFMPNYTDTHKSKTRKLCVC